MCADTTDKFFRPTRRMTMRTLLLTTALLLASAPAFADLAVSGQDGKQVRAGDGLPSTGSAPTRSIW